MPRARRQDARAAAAMAAKHVQRMPLEGGVFMSVPLYLSGATLLTGGTWAYGQAMKRFYRDDGDTVQATLAPQLRLGAGAGGLSQLEYVARFGVNWRIHWNMTGRTAGATDAVTARGQPLGGVIVTEKGVYFLDAVHHIVYRAASHALSGDARLFYVHATTKAASESDAERKATLRRARIDWLLIMMLEDVEAIVGLGKPAPALFARVVKMLHTMNGKPARYEDIAGALSPGIGESCRDMNKAMDDCRADAMHKGTPLHHRSYSIFDMHCKKNVNIDITAAIGASLDVQIGCVIFHVVVPDVWPAVPCCCDGAAWAPAFEVRYTLDEITS